MAVVSEISTDIDTLIQNEQKALVRECFGEIWEELTLEELNSALIAEVLIESSLKKLMAEKGDSAAINVLDKLKQKVDFGILMDSRVLQ